MQVAWIREWEMDDAVYPPPGAPVSSATNLDIHPRGAARDHPYESTVGY